MRESNPGIGARFNCCCAMHLVEILKTWTGPRRNHWMPGAWAQFKVRLLSYNFNKLKRYSRQPTDLQVLSINDRRINHDYTEPRHSIWRTLDIHNLYLCLIYLKMVLLSKTSDRLTTFAVFSPRIDAIALYMYFLLTDFSKFAKAFRRQIAVCSMMYIFSSLRLIQCVTHWKIPWN